MKRILVLLLAAVLISGCSSSDVNSSPKNVINGMMEGIVKKDEQLLTQCLDTENNINELLDNQYTDYKSLKVQEISKEGDSALYAYTGIISYGDDLTVPYLNTVKVKEVDELFYIIEDSIAPYTDLAIEQIDSIKNSEVYKTYSEKLESFLSQENIDKMFKTLEDFKNSEEFAEYSAKLAALMESEEYQSLIDNVKDLPNSELFNNIQNEFNNFINSDEFKDITSQLKDYMNSDEFKNLTDKLKDLLPK